jgi:hypothetical protein
MSERAQALAEQFEQANHEAIATVEGCSDEQWRRHVESENRSVGVVMHHVAIAQPVIAEWVTAAARGQDVGIEKGRIDQVNAQHAREQANCPKAETLDLLRRAVRPVPALCRGDVVLLGSPVRLPPCVGVDHPPRKQNERVRRWSRARRGATGVLRDTCQHNRGPDIVDGLRVRAGHSG